MGKSCFRRHEMGDYLHRFCHDQRGHLSADATTPCPGNEVDHVTDASGVVVISSPGGETLSYPLLSDLPATPAAPGQTRVPA
jgi:hypothetical protein